MVTLLEREVSNAQKVQMYFDALREQDIPVKITNYPSKANCYKISFTSPLSKEQVFKISSDLKSFGYDNSIHMVRRHPLASPRKFNPFSSRAYSKRQLSNYSSFYILVRGKSDIPNEPEEPIILPPPR